MKYELLKTIKRRLYFNDGKSFDLATDADYELINYLVEKNLKWGEKNFQISALDYLVFKQKEYVYLNKSWYISNFIVETTEDEYNVYCRYKKFSKEGEKNV